MGQIFTRDTEDMMLDILAQEDETQAVADLHNGYLCTVDLY